MSNADSLARVWKRIEPKIAVHQERPVVFESSLTNPRLVKVLQIGCYRSSAANKERQLTSAPCAAIVAYGSRPGKMYIYTGKRISSFGSASTSMRDVTYEMMKRYEGFYQHMKSTTLYGMIYEYTYDESMSLDDVVKSMNSRYYDGKIGKDWYTKLNNGMEYPYVSDADSMMLVKVMG